MPRPTDPRHRYLPGLDGIRALAVAVVVAYHLGVPGMSGGLLGVGMFFTLSGYLITAILLRSWEERGNLQLETFWIRRARRLLPALILTLVVVLLTTLVTEPGSLGERARESFFGLVYVANWATIAQGQSYFDRFAGPGPLDHLWSLSVEEQFYVVWPIICLALLSWGRAHGRRLLAQVTWGLIIASSVAMAMLYTPGFDNTRAYEGTDTRAAGLLIGALLAILWRPGDARPGRPGLARRAAYDAAGLLGLVACFAMVALTTDHSAFIYRGGLVLLGIAVCLTVAAVVVPGTLLGRLLGWRPLVWVGERSYGIYLWHLPVMVFAPASFLSAMPVLRGLVLVALTVLLASFSWTLVEEPVRQLGFRGALRGVYDVKTYGVPWWDQPREFARHSLSKTSVAFVMPASLTLVAVTFLGGLASAPSPAPAASTPLSDSAITGTSAVSDGKSSGQPEQVKKVTRTSCREVIHVGDSTSLGLILPSYQPKEALRIPAQYARVGVKKTIPEIAGARSIVETVDNVPNAETVVRKWIDQGYDGCWVFALGTNEAANQAVGGVVPLDQRIDKLMRLVGDQPALWLSVRTLNPSNRAYANDEMAKMNAALLQGCQRHPSMKVYDWAGQVKDSWFISDGIHFTTTGYGYRAHQIARSLVLAFPQGVDSPDASCVVAPPVPKNEKRLVAGKSGAGKAGSGKADSDQADPGQADPDQEPGRTGQKAGIG